MRARARLLTAALVAGVAIAPSLPANAESHDADRAVAAVAWMAKQTSAKHKMLESVAGTADPGLTLDAVLAGLAAGAPQSTTDGWLKAAEGPFKERVMANADYGTQQDNGMIAKALVALSASGRSTTSYDGINPRALTAASFNGSGEAGWSKGTNAFGQGYAMIGLARTGTLPASTVSFVAGKQCADGGFPMNFTAGKGCTAQSDPDGTALLVMGLRAAKAKGIKAADAPLTKAVGYLKKLQRGNGSYWGAPVYTEVENANTTGLVAAALSDLDSGTVARTRTWMGSMTTTSGANSGAIAYSAADKAKGITNLNRGTWVRATTQGLLSYAPVDFYRLKRGGFDVYSTPGQHTLNGRQWRTSCEKYSATTRCRTDIQATVIKQAANGSFYASNGWTFNNLTYQPSARAIWKGNPLATPGTHVVNGRKWFTECDNAKTGRNGCRSYTETSYISNVAKPGQPARYAWTKGMVFNNIVRFTG